MLLTNNWFRWRYYFPSYTS